MPPWRKRLYFAVVDHQPKLRPPQYGLCMRLMASERKISALGTHSLPPEVLRSQQARFAIHFILPNHDTQPASDLFPSFSQAVTLTVSPTVLRDVEDCAITQRQADFCFGHSLRMYSGTIILDVSPGFLTELLDEPVQHVGPMLTSCACRRGVVGWQPYEGTCVYNITLSRA